MQAGAAGMWERGGRCSLHLPLERPVETDVYVNVHFCLEEQSPPKEPPQAAPPLGRSYQWCYQLGG